MGRRGPRHTLHRSGLCTRRSAIDAPSITPSTTRSTTSPAETLNDRLKVDTQINEKTRRLQIHRYILQKGLTTPRDMHKWLYREVLHADLDDPYMGLGKVLFENYPFIREDAGELTTLPTRPKQP